MRMCIVLYYVYNYKYHLFSMNLQRGPRNISLIEGKYLLDKVKTEINFKIIECNVQHITYISKYFKRKITRGD